MNRSRTTLLSLVSLFALFVAPHFASAQATDSSVQPSRIVQAIDESKLVRLTGNVHPVSANIIHEPCRAQISQKLPYRSIR